MEQDIEKFAMSSSYMCTPRQLTNTLETLLKEKKGKRRPHTVWPYQGTCVRCHAVGRGRDQPASTHGALHRWGERMDCERQRRREKT